LFNKKAKLLLFLALALNFAGLSVLKAEGDVFQAEPVFVENEVKLESLETVIEEELEKAEQQAGEQATPEETAGGEINTENLHKVVIDEYSKAEIFDRYRNFTAREYILGPNDIISLKVTGVPELTQENLRINPEGKVNIIYINDLQVAGLTLKELNEVVTGRYKEYVLDPEVVINLEQNRPFIAYISGAVRNPGSYELNTVPNLSPYITKPEAFIERKTPLLSNIIVAAGGLSYDADLEHVKVSNELDGSKFEINLYSLISESDFAQDFFLVSGDKVVVPYLPTPAAIEDTKYRLLVRSTLFQKDIPVRVIGYVNSPGLVRLESDRSANVNSAIAAAGGYITNYGSYPDEVHVRRLDNNNKLVKITINPLKDDIAIMPNDIIYVPEKKIPVFAKFFDYVNRVINPFNNLGNTYQRWEDILD